MPASLVEVRGNRVKIELTVELSRSMLETEEAIQVALNEAGCLASREALRYFDTDGSPLKIGPEIWRTKGQQPKLYQTPDGEVHRRPPGPPTREARERHHLLLLPSPADGLCRGLGKTLADRLRGH